MGLPVAFCASDMSGRCLSLKAALPFNLPAGVSLPSSQWAYLPPDACCPFFLPLPHFPTAVRRQSSPAGAQEVWRGLFSRFFCMKKPADPGLWAMPALVQLLLFIAPEPRAVYRIILQYKSARDTVRCRIFPARRQSLLRRPFR